MIYLTLNQIKSKYVIVKRKMWKISEWEKVSFYSTQVIWEIFWIIWEAPTSSLAFVITRVLCPSTAVHILQIHPDLILGVKCCSLYLRCLALNIFLLFAPVPWGPGKDSTISLHHILFTFIWQLNFVLYISY